MTGYPDPDIKFVVTRAEEEEKGFSIATALRLGFPVFGTFSVERVFHLDMSSALQCCQ